MGILRQGILGGFRNKAGSVVGSYWRTLDVIKGLPRISGKAATQAQLDQRKKFGMVTTFLSWFSNLIDVGYKAQSGIETPMNVATSYHLLAAVNGVSPNFVIDYTKVMFSKGKLALPGNILMASTTAAELDITWDTGGADNKFRKATDKASFLVINALKNEYVTVESIVPRSAGAYTILLPAEFSGDTVHCYISFNSQFNKLIVSDSRHIGSLPVL